MNLTELEKMKYWMDAEFSILHLMFAILALLLTDGLIVTLVIVGYMLITFFYTLSRLAILARADKTYLSLPKK